MALLLKLDLEWRGDWEEAFARLIPELEVRRWPEAGDLRDIEYALVWQPPKGFLKGCPNLKAIFSIGAGIDHLASDPELPRRVPVVRMVEPGLTAGMTEFVVMSVLYHHRSMADYAIQQGAHEWAELPQIAAGRRRVGIMGLGVLGSDAADKLSVFGFDLAGWSRTPKHLEGVQSFHGADGLVPFLERVDILVCLLPLTPETEGILDARTLGALPRGAALINVARGGHLVEEDLMAALDSGQIRAASLDVFAREPLPGDHPLWDHPRVVVTPHIASMTIAESAVESVIANIRRIEAGEPPKHITDFERGY